MPWMPSLAWKVVDYMSSSHDRRFRDLDYYLREWYKNISRIANKLLRGHGWQQGKILIRQSDGLSVRWSALCEAISRDRYYQKHPKDARVTTQIMLAALKFGGHAHPRYVVGFECNEFGATHYDEYDKQGGACHIWPVWGGIGDCPEISERTKGVLYIKSMGGHINWNRLGRRDRATTKHCDHFFSIYDPILRSLGLFPGPCMWHAAPETVSNLLRDGAGREQSSAEDPIGTATPGPRRPGAFR